jgi:hypothetical protein
MTAPRIHIRGHGVIYYDIWYQHAYWDYFGDQVIENFVKECDQHNILLEQIKNYVWIIDCGPEGLDSRHLWMLFNWLRENGVQNKNFRVIFTVQEDVDLLPYPAICLTDRMVRWGNLPQIAQSVDWQNLSCGHALLCLMRRDSVDRARFARLLLERFDQNQVLLTLGSNPDDAGIQARQQLMQDIMHPYSFPIVIAQERNSSSAQRVTGAPDTDIFYRAYINLVVESSNQQDEQCWKSVFLTEKSFKPFAWHQFPVWYSVPGTVDLVRSLGFDLFDDLFDGHVYDNIQDADQRKQAVVDLVAKLMTRDLAELRCQHWSRLVQNLHHLQQVYDNYLTHSYQKITHLEQLPHV